MIRSNRFCKHFERSCVCTEFRDRSYGGIGFTAFYAWVNSKAKAVSEVQQKMHIRKFLLKKLIHHTNTHPALYPIKLHKMPDFIGIFTAKNKNTTAYYFVRGQKILL